MKRALLFALVIVCACRPNLPPRVGCRTNTYRCNDAGPQVCADGRWFDAYEIPCADVGQTCRVDADGVARCAEASR